MNTIAWIGRNKKGKVKKFPPLERSRRTGIWAVYRLFNRYYLKSFFGPFFAFAFPILLFGILSSFQNPLVIFPGIAASSAMAVGIIGMPSSIVELKKSVLLKRIGASPVKPWTFTVVVISYVALIILLSTIWLMLWAYVIHQKPSMFYALGTVKGFFSFFYGTFLNIILSLSVGMAVATLSKSGLRAQAIGMLIYFPSAFLSGQFISIELISRVEALSILSRVFPFRYTTMFMIESWVGDINFAGSLVFNSNPFAIHEYGNLLTVSTPVDMSTKSAQDILDLINALPNKGVPFNEVIAAAYPPVESYTTKIFYDDIDHILAYVSPFAFIGAALGLSLWRFSWST